MDINLSHFADEESEDQPGRACPGPQSDVVEPSLELRSPVSVPTVNLALAPGLLP